MPKRPSEKTSSEARYSTRDLLRDLFGFLSPYRGDLILASLARLSGDIIGLYPSFAAAALVTFISQWRPGASITPAYWLLGTLYATFMARQALMYLAKMRGFLAGERAALDAQERGMEQLFRLDIAWHERENAGNKLKRLDNGASGVMQLVRMWIGRIIEIAVTLIGVLVILATVDPFISIVLLVFLAVYLPVSIWLRRDAGHASRAVNIEGEKLNGAMFESINNVRTAKVLDMPPALMNIIRRAASLTYAKVLTRVKLFQRMVTTQGFLTATFRTLALVYIVQGIFAGRFEVGFLVLFHGYFGRLIETVGEISDSAQEATTAKQAIARMMEMHRETVIDPGTRDFPRDWKVISLRDVGYSYSGRRVLDGVSFDIRRGERVGVVGLSGAGKSTLFKLLLKELEDYTGEILVDDVSLRSIRKNSFYRRAAVVLQETEVFNFSLRQNITIAAPDRTDGPGALEQALDTAYVTDFMKRLPDGVETVIGEKGVKLSGGERQRVGIARAIFKKPDILFLDEATSHLDIESEERIRDSLHTFFGEVTAVVIAHRLTTIREMDRIVVLEAGRLLEQGSFDELQRARGRFHELWEKQKLG